MMNTNMPWFEAPTAATFSIVALYDPFRVGFYFGLQCYKYSTPMGS